MTGLVSGADAAAISGLFNINTRAGRVAGTAVFGGFYLAVVRGPGQVIHGFDTVSLAMAVTALAAAVMGGLSIRQQRPSGRWQAFGPA